LSELPLRLPPSSQFCIDLHLVFLKLWMTPNPRNDERRRNLHRPDELAVPSAASSSRGGEHVRLEKRRRSSFTRTSASPTGLMIPPVRHPSKIGAMLIEIVVRIAHVRVFRLVTDFRREFRVTAMDVWNV
jgi:hypothetical protein